MQESWNELSRRSFLGRLAAATSALIAAALGAVGGAYVAAPALAKREDGWVDVGPSKGIPAGVPTKVDFVERKRDAWSVAERRSSAWLLTSNGKDFIAFDPRCTHLGCPYRWDPDKRQFLCPCHTAVFGVDGRVVMGPPPRPLDRFQVKVAGGRVSILPRPEKPA